MHSAVVLFLNIMVMFLYAIPGFLLVKSKLLKQDAISGINILLLYVAQPCLVYYALTKVSFSKQILLNMLYTFLIALFVMMLIIFTFYFFTRKKQKESVTLRIANISIAFGNCTFIGLPLLEALLPEYKESSIYSVVFFLSMSIIGWTVACFIISGDKKYISVKKIFLNPATLGLIACMPFFLFSYSLPEPFNASIVLLGRMSTPLCMIILGMRLASISFKSVLFDKSKYLVIFLRHFIAPIIYILICIFLPIQTDLKTTLVICGSAPVAAVVLNYSELMGEGQKYSAGVIILSNIASIISMPIIIIIFEAIIKAIK